jgi:hypothetical protein
MLQAVDPVNLCPAYPIRLFKHSRHPAIRPALILSAGISWAWAVLELLDTEKHNQQGTAKFMGRGDIPRSLFLDRGLCSLHKFCFCGSWYCFRERGPGCAPPYCGRGPSCRLDGPPFSSSMPSLNQSRSDSCGLLAQFLSISRSEEVRMSSRKEASLRSIHKLYQRTPIFPLPLRFGYSVSRQKQ